MDDTVCQCGFAVVDVGNDGEITDMLHEVQNKKSRRRRRFREVRILADFDGIRRTTVEQLWSYLLLIQLYRDVDGSFTAPDQQSDILAARNLFEYLVELFETVYLGIVDGEYDIAAL